MAEERYYTISQVAEATNSKVHDIHNAMKANSGILKEGVHYINVEGQQLTRFRTTGVIPRTARGRMKLLTEEGYTVVKAYREAVQHRKQLLKNPVPVQQPVTTQQEEDDSVRAAKIKAAFYEKQYQQLQQHVAQVKEVTGQLLSERQALLDERQCLLNERKNRVEDLQRRVQYLETQNKTMLSVISEAVKN